MLHLCLQFPCSLLLYIQMLADAGGGAEAAEYKAQQHKAADNVIPYIFQRNQLTAEHLREVGRVLGIPAAEGIVRAADDAGGKRSGDQAGGNTLRKERETNKAVGGTHQFHDADLLAAVEHCDLDRIVDDHDGHDSQHRYNAVAGVVDDLLQ